MKKMLKRSIKFICIFLITVIVSNILNVSNTVNAVDDIVYDELENEEIEFVPTPLIIKISEDDEIEDIQQDSPQEEQSIVEDNINIQEEQVVVDDINTAYASSNINPYEGYITEYMDLKNRMNITTEQMDYIINCWVNGRESELTGHGNAFIEASRITGLDPIFLLALAAQEGGWEVSELHTSKNNPYSINMTDENPNGGYHMGDDFYSGIINGAIWVNDNYYNAGQTTLYTMIYGQKRYCSLDGWIESIVSIMDRSYKLIQGGEIC